MSILGKKVVKSIPIWALIAVIVSAGTAFAAYNWISNRIWTAVTITNVPVQISGNFQTPMYMGIDSSSAFTYTVTSTSAPTGYIHITIFGPVSSITYPDVLLTITPQGGSENPMSVIAGYPIVTSGQYVEFLFGNGQNPINFGTSSGTITVYIHPNMLISSDPGHGIEMQITASK